MTTLKQAQRLGVFTGNNRNTLHKDGTTFYILHNTAIVKQNSFGIQLDSGGYMTVTTKKAMNEVGGILRTPSNPLFNVYQIKGQWFVDYNGTVKTFTDGMLLK